MTFVLRLLFLFVTIPFVPARSEVRLPRLFGSHMVIQQQKAVPVWGWADPGEKIEIRLNQMQRVLQTRTIKTGKDGKWNVSLEPVAAGGPYRIEISGKNSRLVLDDVLSGEVWIGSGQSNMEMLVARCRNFEEEREAAVNPLIRHFKIPHDKSLTPLEDVSGGEWVVASPETVGDFSATAFFFARELFARLKVPVGLINASWGGTQIESWISREAMSTFEEFREPLARMPVSLEAFNAQRKKQLDDLILSQQGSFPDAEAVRNWNAPAFDDSDWKQVEMPGYVDLKQVPGLDGVVWLRKEILLPAEFEGRAMVLMSGTIDDTDITYVNGVKVGQTERKTPAGRNYIIPENVLKAGRNVIAIRVEDLGGICGIAGKPEQMKIASGTYGQSLAGSWKYRVETSVDNRQLTGGNIAATILYNAMIAPLIPFAMRGILWYQGESNAPRAFQYRKSFPLLVNDWRSRWKETFPFLFVQLSSYKGSGGDSRKGSTWAELREAQAMTLSLLPNMGMAVTSDIGETEDIHPKNKQDVGKRLAYNALRLVYGHDIVYTGPVFGSAAKVGNKMEIRFDQVGSGLKAEDPYGYLRGFEIAGPDRNFHWAQARIEGSKVIVWADQVTDPAAVRYGWCDDNREANLYNREGIPAAPFRTDAWEGITEGNVFK